MAPEVAFLDLFGEQRARAGAVVHVVEQVGADVVEHVESAEVDAGDRADQVPAAAEAVLHHVVHGGRVRDALLDDVERLAQHGQLQAVAHKAQRFLLDLRRLLADLGHEVEGDVHYLRVSFLARHHFDQRHELCGVPEVRHHEAFGVSHHQAVIENALAPEKRR